MLIEALDDDNQNVQCVAALALGRIGDRRAVEPLVAKVCDRSGGCSPWWAMAQGLAMLGDRRGVEPLIAALDDPRTDHYAAGCLADLPDPRAIEPLTRVFRNAQDPEHIHSAASALAKLGAVEPLLKSLGDERLLVRLYAIMGLGEARETRALDLIRPMADDPDDRIRRVAGEAVRRIEAANNRTADERG